MTENYTEEQIIILRLWYANYSSRLRRVIMCAYDTPAGSEKQQTLAAAQLLLLCLCRPQWQQLSLRVGCFFLCPVLQPSLLSGLLLFALSVRLARWAGSKTPLSSLYKSATACYQPLSTVMCQQSLTVNRRLSPLIFGMTLWGRSLESWKILRSYFRNWQKQSLFAS